MGSSFGGSSSTFCFGSNFPDMLIVVTDPVLELILLEIDDFGGVRMLEVKLGKQRRLGINRGCLLCDTRSRLRISFPQYVKAV